MVYSILDAVLAACSRGFQKHAHGYYAMVYSKESKVQEQFRHNWSWTANFEPLRPTEARLPSTPAIPVNM